MGTYESQVLESRQVGSLDIESYRFVQASDIREDSSIVGDDCEGVYRVIDEQWTVSLHAGGDGVSPCAIDSGIDERTCQASP